MIELRSNCWIVPATAALLIVVTPEQAMGYGGPGSVISGIGALLAAVAAIGAALFGFVWFPAKRLVRKLRHGGGEGAVEDGANRKGEAGS